MPPGVFNMVMGDGPNCGEVGALQEESPPFRIAENCSRRLLHMKMWIW